MWRSGRRPSGFFLQFAERDGEDFPKAGEGLVWILLREGVPEEEEPEALGGGCAEQGRDVDRRLIRSRYGRMCLYKWGVRRSESRPKRFGHGVEVAGGA
jgi:hypothetical protein